MSKRILVVDDDPDLREATQIILASAGYQVVTAEGAEQARRELKQGPKVDLILLDVMMETDTAGFHLAYELRRDEALKDVPIILLTCIEEKTGQSLDVEKAGDFLPVEAFLRKPLEASALKAKIAEVLEGAKKPT